MKELITIQTKLKCHKSQYNSFGKYNYRSLEDILESVKPLLEETKCYIVISDTIELIGNRYYVKATATISNEQGQQQSNSAYAREAEEKKGMDACQITGATSSYARKYALNGLLAIDDTKDSDSTNEHGKGQKNSVTIDSKNVDNNQPEYPPQWHLFTEGQRTIYNKKNNTDYPVKIQKGDAE